MDAKIDTNIEILKEPLIEKLSNIKPKRVSILTYNGIETISDFLKADIDNITSTDNVRRQLKGLQKVLKYKYLGRTLPQDVILDDVYHIGYASESINKKNMECLGFVMVNRIITTADKLLAIDSQNSPKIIDIVREVIKHSEEDDYTNYLAKFYSNYYRKNIENTNEEINPEVIMEIKNQIIELFIEIDMLQDKAKRLSKTLEGLIEGNSKNARNK